MLSIVVPTYNEENYLPRLLSSLKRQTFRDFEIIVADNNSQDRTREIALNYGCKVVQGGYPSEGRNRGAEAAIGNIILFLDADVVIHSPYFLESTVKEFENRNLSVATCMVKPLNGGKVDKILHEFYNNYSRLTQPIRPHAPGFCIFSRQEIHKKIKGFDETIKFAEDHDYVIRAGKIGRFRILKSAPLYVSIRRFKKDGYLNVFCKYFLCEVYMLAGGRVRSNVFNYTFGYNDKKIDRR